MRKEDLHIPKKNFFKPHVQKQFKIAETVITEVKNKRNSNRLLIFVHGGAFVAGPGKHHWDTIKKILGKTNFNVWMCDYPKAPEHKIDQISQNIDAVYSSAMERYEAKNIIMIGDSAGATLITSLVQRLIQKNIKTQEKIVLVCPVMDANLTNPDIESIDPLDHILSKPGVLSAKKMCAGDNNLSNPMISPLFGSFTDFPKTMLCLASHDIAYPDEKLAAEKIKKAGVDYTEIYGNEMPHIWPFLPVMKESKQALQEIIEYIK